MWTSCVSSEGLDRSRLDIPVHFKGQESSPGLKRGGVLNIVRHTVELLCPVDNIPEFIEGDLSRTRHPRLAAHLGVHTARRRKPTIRERDFTVASIVAPTSVIEEQKAAAAAAAAAANAPVVEEAPVATGPTGAPGAAGAAPAAAAGAAPAAGAAKGAAPRRSNASPRAGAERSLAGHACPIRPSSSPGSAIPASITRATGTMRVSWRST